MYAINMTTGIAQPVFAQGNDVCVNDDPLGQPIVLRSVLQPSRSKPVALKQYGSYDSGHGFNALDGNTRAARDGGGTLYFGFDDLTTDFNHLSANPVNNTGDQPAGFTDTISPAVRRALWKVPD